MKEQKGKLTELLYSITSLERDLFINEYGLDIRKSRTWDELTKSSKASWQEIALPLIEFVEGELKEAIKAGIKEVVDYIESRAIPNSFMPINTRTQWQDQLQEWGIDTTHDVNKDSSPTKP